MTEIKALDIKKICASVDDSKNWKVLGFEVEHELPNLGSVNIFCGENNSGKSRFLRMLAKGWFNGIGLNIDNVKYIQKFISNFEMKVSEFGDLRILHLNTTVSKFREAFISNPIVGLEKVNQIWDQRFLRIDDLAGMLSETDKTMGGLSSGKTRVVKNIEDQISSSHPNPKLQELVTKLTDEVIEIYKKIISDSDFSKLPRSSLYVPIIRSTHKLGIGGVNKTLDQNFSDIYEIKEVMSGVTVYDELRKYLLTSSTHRKKVVEYEKYLSELFFEGKEVFLSPDNDKIKIKIDGHGERELFNFGDGVTSLIILTFDAFFSDKAKCYFLEEPEIYLHPGMQRRFLDIISGNVTHESSRFSRHVWFFTTHSNHFLDLSLSHEMVSVYSFRSSKENANVKEIKPLVLANDYSDRRLALESLGVQASSVFRVNRLIWVEGITDILIIRNFLMNYLFSQEDKSYASLREDIDFSFVIYGGSNLAQFDFSDNPKEIDINVKSICDNNLVILDGDVRNKPRGQDILQNVNIKSYALICKEIENLVASEIVKDWVNKTFERDLVKLKPEDIVEARDKIKDIDDSGYQSSENSLGKYLDETLGVTYFNYKGTIRDKVEFAHHIHRFDEQSFSYNEQGAELANAILSFLRS